MLNTLIVLLVMVIAIPLLIYISSIAILRQFFHKTGEEAKKTVDNALTKIINLFKQNPPYNVVYPVLLGDGVSISDSLINTLCRKYDDYFEAWFFVYATFISSNVICYEFSAYEPKFSDKKVLLFRTRRVAEKALVMYWHDIGVYNLKPDNFIATTYHTDILRVYIACNDEGFKEIAEIRRQPK